MGRKPTAGLGGKRTFIQPRLLTIQWLGFVRPTLERELPVTGTRYKMVAPQPHGFMAKVDPTLEQKILDIAQAQRKAAVHHDQEADDLRR